jgi:ribosomal protein L11 methyltransferase
VKSAPQFALPLRVPYRIDISSPPDDAFYQLVQLGALDIEPVNDQLAAIIPDHVTPDAVTAALGVTRVTVSSAIARDNGSVWLLSPKVVRVASILIAPPQVPASPGVLRLIDSATFGTGHHPTTALCIQALEEAISLEHPNSVLDVGTGSGVLALAALMLGAPRAVGIDIDADALDIAAENARLNHLGDRLQLLLGGPDVLDGIWPLVVANVLAASLIEMAPALVRRVGQRGRVILSGVPPSVESEVKETYQRLGMRHIRSETRAGWTAVVLQASW